MYRIIGADGREYGPASTDQLRQWITEGRVVGQTQIQEVGGSEWRMLSTIPELFGQHEVRAAPPAMRPVTLESAPSASGMAVAGLVMGILTWTFGLCCGGPIFALLGIIFSAVGISHINKSSGRLKGKGMAIAGLIMSILGLVLTIALLILFGAMGIWEELSKQGRF